MTIRVVLDTNVVLDCFVFRDPGIADLRASMLNGTAIAITNASCFEELERVLAYGQLDLAPEERPAVLAAMAGPLFAGMDALVGVDFGSTEPFDPARRLVADVVAPRAPRS